MSAASHGDVHAPAEPMLFERKDRLTRNDLWAGRDAVDRLTPSVAPVILSFFDSGSVERRRETCEREVELNQLITMLDRRLAEPEPARPFDATRRSL